MLARAGGDGRLADGDRQARLGHSADPFACNKHQPRPRLAPAQPHADQRAVGDVGVVARVLDDTRLRPAFALRFDRQGKGRFLTAGQADRHRVLEPLPPQRAES